MEEYLMANRVQKTHSILYQEAVKHHVVYPHAIDITILSNIKGDPLTRYAFEVATITGMEPCLNIK